MRILIIADIHNKTRGSRKTLRSIKNIIEKTECDLIVFLGDIIHGPATPNNYEKYLRQVLDLTSGKPFATVFGNHDDECETGKEEILKVIMSYKNSLTQKGDYVLEMNGETLLFIDSGSYYSGEGSFYDTVKKEQIDFALSKIKGKKAILFQHIIMPDIMELIEHSDEKLKGGFFDDGKYHRFKSNVEYTGFIKELPCPPDINTGELEALSPYLKAAVFGHDHKNTFETEIMGVKFIQCGGSGSNSYDKYCKSNVKLLDTQTLETSLIYI